MKRVMSVLAVVIFSIGLFSCEANTDDTSYDTEACGGCQNKTDSRE